MQISCQARWTYVGNLVSHFLRPANESSDACLFPLEQESCKKRKQNHVRIHKKNLVLRWFFNTHFWGLAFLHNGHWWIETMTVEVSSLTLFLHYKTTSLAMLGGWLPPCAVFDYLPLHSLSCSREKLMWQRWLWRPIRRVHVGRILRSRRRSCRWGICSIESRYRWIRGRVWRMRLWWLLAKASCFGLKLEQLVSRMD